MNKTWKFPAGEIGVLVEPVYCTHTIRFDFTGSDSIFELLLKVDAHRRMQSGKLRLDMPYVPYARQDRVMQPGESHSLKVFCDLINGCKFESVLVVDPHSHVVEALLDNLIIKEQHEAVIETVPNLESYDYFIAPDAGALKKIYKLAQRYEKPVICAGKNRDVSTGNITGSYITAEDYEKLIGKKALIVDDICDGGRTFTELRVILPTTSTVDLYITHGIFSKGKKVVEDVFNKVFCYNDMSVNN